MINFITALVGIAADLVDMIVEAVKGVPPEQMTAEVRAEIGRLKLSLAELDASEQAELDAAVPRD